MAKKHLSKKFLKSCNYIYNVKLNSLKALSSFVVPVELDERPE